MKKIITMWCEKCKAETPHKEIGYSDYKGVMHPYFSCEIPTCYNEKVIAVGVQIHKGVFIKEAAPKEEKKTALGKFMSLLNNLKG